MHKFPITTGFSVGTARILDNKLKSSQNDPVSDSSRFQPMRNRRLSLVMLLIFLAACSIALAASGDEKYYFKAQLIWASNEDLSSDDLHPLDDKTTEKLRKVFKWENYWEINKKYVDLEEDVRKITKISPECEITLKRIETEEECKVEVVLIGKKNPIVKKTQHIQQDECLVLAGPDKDGTAWFVILTRIDKMPEEEKQGSDGELTDGDGTKLCYCPDTFDRFEVVTLFAL